MYQRYFLWEIQPSDGLITAKKLMPWVNQKTDRNIPYVESIYTFLEALMYLVVTVGVLLYVYFQFKSFVLNPMLWMVVIFFAFFISYAGCVFNVLNNVPWSGRDEKGKETYIAKGSRTQYQSEGLLMSGSLMAVAFFWILFTKIPSWISNS